MLFPTPDPMVEKYPSYFILCFISPHGNTRISEKIQEIDFIIGKDFIITTSYDNIDALHKFGKILKFRNSWKDAKPKWFTPAVCSIG